MIDCLTLPTVLVGLPVDKYTGLQEPVVGTNTVDIHGLELHIYVADCMGRLNYIQLL
jgi:hypothetical protein